MNTCEEHGNSAVVVYTTIKCPACELQDSFESSEDAAATLRVRVDDLTDELRAAEATIQRLESDAEEAEQQRQAE